MPKKPKTPKTEPKTPATDEDAEEAYYRSECVIVGDDPRAVHKSRVTGPLAAWRCHECEQNFASAHPTCPRCGASCERA